MVYLSFSGLEGAAEAADDAVSHPDNEVSQINSTASSPNKPVRNTSAAPKQPRPPKHNFKILGRCIMGYIITSLWLAQIITNAEKKTIRFIA